MIKIKIIFLLMIVSVFVGCNNVKDVEYCRDLKIGENLTRSELVRLNIVEQRKIFNELPSETKCDLYIFKITEDIKNAGLSEGEKIELNKLASKLKPSVYEKADDSFNEYAKEFEERMRTEYGWTEEDLFKYTMVIMTAKEYEEYLTEHDTNIVK